jgi:uncharacterized protein YuzE
MEEMNKYHMPYTYDAEANAVYLYLAPPGEAGYVKSSAFVEVRIPNGSLIVSLDEAGNAMGIEFLGASNVFSREALEGFKAGKTPPEEIKPSSS